MSKSAVTDWDTTAGNNSDIGGINIAEGCPAAGVNDALRTIMSQIATWLAAATGPVLKVGGYISNSQQVTDGASTARYVGYRNIPLTAKSASYVIALTDVGQGLTTTAGVTVPPNSTVAFAVGDTVVVYNNSGSSITITQGAGVTLRLIATATTGNRTLAQRGLCTLLKVATDEWVASGGGVS
jgi:hypothetical protein